MSTTAKASDHVKPCNIAQSERHNRRDPDYIKSLDPAKLYVRLDLSKNNSSYVAPGMEGVTLEQHRESIRVMVKQKTGRAMQENDVKYTDKNGKEHTRKGCSPIRESVVNIKEDTALDNLLEYARMVEARWGIKAIQIHLHKDEGHYEDPVNKKFWKPNYHAHIIWDWMDHETGKSFKLNADDMSEMQDMVAEALDMERGRKKSETGLDHLERNDFIIQKQEKEKKRLEEEKRKIQSENDKAKNQARIANKEKESAEKKAQEAKTQAKLAVAIKDKAEQKAEEAKAELARIESKTNEKQTEIDELDQKIGSKQELIEKLQKEATKQRQEIFSLEGSKDWKDHALIVVSSYVISIDETVRNCLRSIIDYAYSGTGGRGGKHGDFFWDEESSAIKRLMTKMADLAKATLRTVSSWLIWMASTIGQFNEWEQRRAERGVNDIADGGYDWRIERYENRNGISR